MGAGPIEVGNRNALPQKMGPTPAEKIILAQAVGDPK